MADNLEIRDLHTSIDDKEILNGVNLTIQKGKVHVIMGPNGSGKSTLANTLMGHPKYQVRSGEILFKDKNVVELSPDERAKLGIFLAFQYPLEIPGVTFSNFLRTAYNATHPTRLSVPKFREKLTELIKKLRMDESFLTRYLNEGFSGGEKKKAEALQMLLLQPELVILDETDSGLDVDALKVVAAAIKEVATENTGVLVITHYQRILDYLKPDYVHVMRNGKIVQTGGPELVAYIEEQGYEIHE